MSTQTLTENFNFRLLKSIEEKFKNINFASDEYVYFFYARPLDYTVPGVPDQVEDSINEENSTKSNIVSLKRVNENDISLGFNKYEWTPNTVYVEYTDQRDLSDEVFYVINTSNNNIYKCIDNNNGAPSLVAPEGTSTSLIRTSDNYIWKYMFNISEPLLRKYDLEEYLPFSRDEDVENDAISGSIEKIIVQSGGSNFEPNSIIPVFVEGNGDENATCQIDIQNLSPGTQGIRPGSFAITNAGSGYDIIETYEGRLPVLIRQTVEETATVQSLEEKELAFGWATVNSNGQITDLEIIQQGTNYRVGTASVVQSSCVAFAKVNNQGNIQRIDIEESGRNFTRAQTFLVNRVGLGAVTQPVISPPGGHGSNPQIELYANSLLFNVRIIYGENDDDFPVDENFDFRTIGLLENPLLQNGDKATQESLSGMTTINTANGQTSNFQLDELIVGTNSGARATLVDIPSDSSIRLIRDDEQSNSIPFQENEVVLGSRSSENTQIDSINQPNYLPYSGNILFIKNRESITRSENQIESINFILNF